ncbi:hypothetical protein N7457_003644 [Penicillium paradoxum]|uniref:uncharacterized protein n=1 Tax=Penicillium paradoxum TaxID=176176 RepID=UPI002547634B|nr:uncharacterized protein N7457_003644 [Penicillium paradoxum]KAJ5788654.1 hypothetical protein N7457_003644 [Penicillium paradoxum]
MEKKREEQTNQPHHFLHQERTDQLPAIMSPRSVKSQTEDDMQGYLEYLENQNVKLNVEALMRQSDQTSYPDEDGPDRTAPFEAIPRSGSVSFKLVQLPDRLSPSTRGETIPSSILALLNEREDWLRRYLIILPILMKDNTPGLADILDPDVLQSLG